MRLLCSPLPWYLEREIWMKMQSNCVILGFSTALTLENDCVLVPEMREWSEKYSCFMITTL